ncbi:hypothetical protein EVAR_98779_1 [Eumeta japonica]|uniref:Uncharacterized protein n=1 Tax=Eumeta variegata TaxID=151549 RepID=A0A4C1YSM4_EUMVA|nr:hypothetical protein EVAR_98779_1 [Eumeta japonica]
MASSIFPIRTCGVHARDNPSTGIAPVTPLRLRMYMGGSDHLLTLWWLVSCLPFKSPFKKKSSSVSSYAVEVKLSILRPKRSFTLKLRLVTHHASATITIAGPIVTLVHHIGSQKLELQAFKMHSAIHQRPRPFNANLHLTAN